MGICGVKLVGEDGTLQRGCTASEVAHMVAIAAGASAPLPSLFPTHLMGDCDHG